MPSFSLFPIFFSSFSASKFHTILTRRMSTFRSCCAPRSRSARPGKSQFFHDLLAPERDKQDKEACGQKPPRDQDYLDAESAHGWNVTGDIRVFVEKSVPIAKDIYEGDNVH